MATRALRILMVHENPCIRVLKQAQALVRQGVRVDVLCQKADANPEILGLAGEVLYFRDLNDLKGILEKTGDTWDVIHCHNEPNEITAVAILAVPSRPVVYDCHDFSGLRSRLTPDQIGIERFCFQHSSAVVHVSEGMKRIARQRYGNNVSIVLPSYPSVSDIPSGREDKLSGNHIVYLGGLTNVKNTKYSYRYYYPYFRRLLREGVEVHAYPARLSWRGNNLDAYTALADRNAGFHLHRSLPYGQLIQEISRYQWGLSGFNLDRITAPDSVTFLQNALPNKLFDYLLAGVCPVVINNETAGRFVEDRGLGYRAGDMEEFTAIVTTRPPLPPLPDYAPIDMDTQIGKLIALYEAVTREGAVHPAGRSGRPGVLPDRETPDPAQTAGTAAHHYPGESSPWAPIPGPSRSRAMLDQLLAYYRSDVWRVKEPDMYFSHTSDDTHAFFLMALLGLHRARGGDPPVAQAHAVADYLLARGRWPGRAHVGWGLGMPLANAINRANGTPPCGADACYTYTSCYVAQALLDCYETTGRSDCLAAARSWRKTLFSQVGMDAEGGYVYYSDSPLHHAPYVFTWIPNVTALSIGFLARLAALTEEDADRPVIGTLATDLFKRMVNGNWAYDNGQFEDPFHLGMILEGLWLGRDALPAPFDPASCVVAIIREQFDGQNVRETPFSLGSQGWGLAMTLLMLRRFGLAEGFFDRGMDYLWTHPHLAFGNIRSAGMYARLLAELEEAS